MTFKALTQRPPFLNVIVKKDHKFMPAENDQVFIGPWNIRFNFMVSEFSGRRRELQYIHSWLWI